MTVLDDRTGLARLAPTPLSLLRDAIDRAEGDVDALNWEIYASADADAFKGLDVDSFPLPFKGESRKQIVEHLADTRGEIESEVDSLGDQLRMEVIKVLEKLADDFESELVRATL